VIRVAIGEAEVASEDALVVRISDTARSTREATIAVCIADARLAAAVTHGIASAFERQPAVEAEYRTVQLRSRKSLARLGEARAGAEQTIVIVPVTERNARHLLELVDGIRAAGASGVQLVWDGTLPDRARVERHIFAVLERARATPNEPPVVLATSDRPVAALKLLVAHRSKRSER
jgi:hypothetical protein